MPQIRRALLSVSNKEGVVEFAKALSELKVEIISTGGTANHLNENGIPTRAVSDVTSFPEILNGRVKTLHPKIFGGLLAVRDDDSQISEAKDHNVELIDLVAVNLYPFEETVANAGSTHFDALENIDIGGPSLIRAAAKNYMGVAVVTSPDQYPKLIREIQNSKGQLSLETRKRLAAAAFALTAAYDFHVNRYLSNGSVTTPGLPDTLHFGLTKITDLRYGENPHQRAALYRDFGSSQSDGTIAGQQLHGKELSFNNLLDLDAALGVVQEFPEPCAVIIKHTNPCGLALADDLCEAFLNAKATDPVSAFGGIIGVNRKVEQETAKAMSEMFIEAIIAPEFHPAAMAILTTKKNLRIIESLEVLKQRKGQLDLKRVQECFLVQHQDFLKLNDIMLKVMSKRQPTDEEWRAMKLGWRVCKWVKSNAIVFSSSDRTIGVGAGQMSRVDSSRFAIDKAKRFGLSLAGTAVASDAFFPFRDGVDVAAEVGASAVIQPGGSIRDQEVIEAADEHNMAMVFTATRHFRH